MKTLKGSMLAPPERIQQKILLIRGLRVMLDADLAQLYGVETRALIQAVKRNLERFPEDFMFQLTNQELEIWRSQSVISNPAAKMGLRRRPYAFSEHGVAMLSSVLRSQTAIRVNIQIVRSFVKLRELLLSNEALARRVNELEKRTDRHAQVIISIMQELEKPQVPVKKHRLGF